MQSIMSLMLDDDLVIISGDQARKLKALNVKTGADMLSCAEEQKRLEGENADLVRENGKFYAAIRGEMANVS
jgi:ribosomal silencing factor RsfS